MLRNEIQHKTGLTRKAIEYYEEKGLINPQKNENGYRNYSENDLNILKKIALLRKIGMNVGEIENYLFSEGKSLAKFLRYKQHQLDIEYQKLEIIELILEEENKELVDEKIKLIESKETIYEKLEETFPGYFGQSLFMAYQPFLNEPIKEAGEESYEKFVDFLDDLPTFELTNEEKDYIEDISSNFDMKVLEDINGAKINAIYNPDQWLKSNYNYVKQYEEYKNSDEYKSSLTKQIYNKLYNYMKDNNYYEIAIPLIRKFSKSYDEYYEKLLKANEIYLNQKD